jgi:serine protease
MTRRFIVALGAALGLVAPAAALCVSPSAPDIGRLRAYPKAVLWPAGVQHPAAPAPGANQKLLGYGGAIDGGVITRPALYLVYWGSQWSSTDPYAAYETAFFKGLFGRGDDWTKVATEYCERVANGATSCPKKAVHVGRPSGPLVKGVWFDNSSLAVPTDVLGVSPATDTVANEALRAAAHFGNTTPASNLNAVYLINEPSHYDSAGYGSYFCAYHTAVDSTTYGRVAYADLPHVDDVDNALLGFATLCGKNAVNKGDAGRYDGVSIVAGHEFMEILTDPDVGTGWTDGSGKENADKCAGIYSGQGAMTDLRLSTGTFAVQSTWSNKFNNGLGGCVVHADHP